MMDKKNNRLKKDALDYHSNGKPGKMETIPTKPYSTQRDLSLAYSPGVAEPCLSIAKKENDIYKYTNKGNLVGVISNGTAVLGLGNIGPKASKPVMEGKALLFKIFADIDVFDIEIDTENVDEFIQTVKNISPTFGGINLEDIKAPEAFQIETRLKDELNIPVMHDDQHGTAIISGAALVNALELVNKKIEDVHIVVNGSGAAAISCAKLYIALGVKKEHLVMLDSKGVLHKSRKDLNDTKQFFATDKDVFTLEEALKEADVFLGLSVGDIVSKAMVKSMAKDAIVFALANPNPEIAYEDAIKSRDDIIIATGRSDYPNQVNNVLGFPYIFRGALDVRATKINEAMKIAAVYAITELTKEAVPEEVIESYELENLSFGRDYIIPKPFDPRLIQYVAPAVAKAAMDSGVATDSIKNWERYKEQLSLRTGKSNTLIQNIVRKYTKAKTKKSILFPEGEQHTVLKAAEILKNQNIAEPILLGDKQKIIEVANKYIIDIDAITIIDVYDETFENKREKYTDTLFENRKRKGINRLEAMHLLKQRNYIASMMLNNNEVHAVISGTTKKYPSVLQQVLKSIDTSSFVFGLQIILSKNGPLFFADTAVNTNPSTDEIVKITLSAAKAVKKLKIEPVIALLSFSNFGSSPSQENKKMSDAVHILHEKHPELIVDGEMQADFALDPNIRGDIFPFSKLAQKQVNVLIFPNLQSSNISYKLIQKYHGDDTIGPILLGMKKPFYIAPIGSNVREIVNLATMAISNI